HRHLDNDSTSLQSPFGTLCIHSQRLNNPNAAMRNFLTLALVCCHHAALLSATPPLRSPSVEREGLELPGSSSENSQSVQNLFGNSQRCSPVEETSKPRGEFDLDYSRPGRERARMVWGS
ncbi:hypothetical protein PTTG_25793, partial [Puccinia triticina 1-1 BBBD Race 1]